jgi:UDP:flavonoid glycosyltransferase YjiC (YdhE family)
MAYDHGVVLRGPQGTRGDLAIRWEPNQNELKAYEQGRNTLPEQGARYATTENSTPRVLFMSEAIAISHVVRPVVLASYLARKGYHVCVARDPRYSHLVSEGGLPFVDLKSIPTAVVEARLARHEPVHDAATLDQYVQEDLRVIREFKPDVVVGDLRHSLAVSSRLARVPYINIADAHWAPAVRTDYELPNSPLSGVIGMPLSNLLFQFIQPFAFAYQTLPLNMVRMKYGLPPISPDIKACNTFGDYTVYPNDPALFPLSQPLPASQSFIGPVSWSPTVDKPAWWNSLPPDLPIVYVSLGSTGQPGFLDIVFKVLCQLPITVIAATADRWRKTAVAANVFLADFLPGAESAERASLVICNGGTMSGQQALSAGTPYLGLISNLDQMLFSMAVRRASACELLRQEDVNERNMRKTVESMLAQERYQKAAEKLAAGAAALESPKNFEAILCSILERQSTYNPVRQQSAV